MDIDPKLVKQLRDQTGAGMMECKKALQEGGGSFEKAKEILAKQGAVRAERMGSRPTKEGRIGCYVHPNGRLASMVELTCETDFVAKTPEFQRLLHHLCIQVAGAAPEVVSKNDLPADLLAAERARYADEVKGKPEAIAAKIVEGKLEKTIFSQRCLLQQPFVNEAEFTGTVEELIKSVIGTLKENITVRRFSRFELGG
jgi:elongation factor Ts